MDAEQRFRAAWEGKTKRQVQREIESMRRYMDRHSAAYDWHGKGGTPPGVLADGDKMTILKEIFASKFAEKYGTKHA